MMFFELSITFSTFSETSIASLVLLLLTHNSVAGFPSTKFKILLFSTLDFIFAISPSITLPPEIEFFNSNVLKVFILIYDG